MEVERYALRGEFFWLRTENGRFERAFATAAHSLHWDGEAVFESERALPGVSAGLAYGRPVIEEFETGDQTHVRHLRDHQLRAA